MIMVALLNPTLNAGAAQAARKAGTVVYFYCGPHPWRRANASVLVGIWQVLYLERTAEQAYAPLAALPPCEEFRDASSGASLLPLTILDVIQVGSRTLCMGARRMPQDDTCLLCATPVPNLVMHMMRLC